MAIEHKSPPLGPGTAMPAPGLFYLKPADYAEVPDTAVMACTETMTGRNNDFLTEQMFEFNISSTNKTSG